MSPVVSNPSNAVNRKDHREALYNLLLPLTSGDESIVQAVVTGTPGTELNVQSPTIIILSAGSERDPVYQGGAQVATKFFLTVSVWVTRKTPDADDTLDTIEKLITDIVNDNRAPSPTVTVPWQEILSNGRTIVIPSEDKGGLSFHVETMPFTTNTF